MLSEKLTCFNLRTPTGVPRLRQKYTKSPRPKARSPARVKKSERTRAINAQETRRVAAPSLAHWITNDAGGKLPGDGVERDDAAEGADGTADLDGDRVDRPCHIRGHRDADPGPGAGSERGERAEVAPGARVVNDRARLEAGAARQVEACSHCL